MMERSLEALKENRIGLQKLLSDAKLSDSARRVLQELLEDIEDEIRRVEESFSDPACRNSY